MLINAANLRALQTGYQAAFNQGFDGAAVTYDRLAMTVPSTTGKETYGWLGQTPGLREWIGDREVQNLAAHDYTIKNKSFELTIGVDRDDIEDDSYGIYSPLMTEMGRAARQHPDTLVYGLLKDGFAATCYDGQYFFDTDHPGPSGASLSNVQAGAGNPWYLVDASRAIKPLIFQKRKDYQFQSLTKPDDANVFHQKRYIYGVDARGNVGFGLWQLAFGSQATLDATNYAAARASMMSLVGDEGRPLGITPNLLVCGPSNEGAARALLMNERDANGATNGWRNTAELLVVPYLP